MSIRILLVDDQLLFRKGMAALLSSQPDLSVVGDVRGGKEGVQAALSMDPDMIMMDILQVGVCGLDTVAQIKQRQPQIRVILLTGLRTRDYVRAALGVGADGYVLKDANLDELLMAIRSVAAGKMYLSPEVSCFLVDVCCIPSATRPIVKAGTAQQPGAQRPPTGGRGARFLVEGLLHPERTQTRSSKLERLNNRERSVLSWSPRGEPTAAPPNTST